MKSNILVLEDNTDLQKIYRQILAQKYNLFQAYDTKEAYKILAKEEIDLMVLDIILPNGKDGDKFYMQLTQRPEYASIPTIFATVIDDNEEAESLNNINNAAWITKPFKKEELLKKIDEMLKK